MLAKEQAGIESTTMAAFTLTRQLLEGAKLGGFEVRL